jgi:uncharacterized delta-60 repeat protein
MNNPIRLTVCTLLLAVSNLSAATLYVSLGSTNPLPPYATWATAATNIQDAVDAAAAGDAVVVTNGTYATGGRAVGTNVLANRVAVDKPLTLRSVNGPEVTAILGCRAPGAPSAGAGSIRCVYLADGASLSGFTLTNGATQGAPVNGPDGPFYADMLGGGVLFGSGTAVVSDCVLSGNSAACGGGACGGTLYRCTLTNNGALVFGGGASECMLNECTLSANGGLTWCTGCTSGGGADECTLNNCLLTGNWAHWGSGASGCTLYNCTLSGNCQNNTGTSGAPGSTLYNCIVYPDSTGSYLGYPACTLICCWTSDPLFVDAATGNFRLQPDSPCIDAGDNDYALGPVDLDGNPRISNGTVDIGAYEFQVPTSGPPVVLRPPASLTTDAGTTATFGVVAGGSEPLSFQWLMDGLPLADGGNRAGTGTGVLTLTNVVSADAGGYSVVVSNQYGTATSSVALLTVNLATLDGGFNPGAYTNSTVFSLALQPDGKILVAGFFMTLGGQMSSCIARFNADGTVDTAFNSAASTEAYALALQADGKIVVGGFFTTLGGQSRSYLGRLNADGTVDSGFNPGADSTVCSLALQADGKILVGGYFGTLGGQRRNYIGRLNADGTVDTSFNPGAGNGVESLALQTDGKILVGGAFTTLGGQSRNYIGRLNADGTVDTSFNPRAGNGVGSLAVQADGKILVGGTFTVLGGQSRNYIGRLNADGTVDSSFNPGADNGVNCLALQTDGKILVGGGFTTLGGQSRNCIGRLNADGTVDSRFSPGANYGVGSLAVQPDGKILVAGSFTTLAGQARQCLGRLNNGEPATQSLNYDGSAITWLRGGASPEVWRTTFDFWTNGADWANLGAGARTAGGWQLGSVSLPSANGTIRARGYVAGGCSAWFVETDLAVSPPLVILVNDPSFGFTSNRFGFKLSGSAGQVVIVETSANLASWTPVATNTVGATPIYFSEPQWTNYPARFYRLRWP